jgi:two-component sensor histidine kinase
VYCVSVKASGKTISAAVVDPPVRTDLQGFVAASDPAASLDLDFRVSALRVGSRLGWAALLAVLIGTAVGAKVGNEWLVLALTAAAAAGNFVAMRVPWRDWLGNARGHALLDLWSGALIGFVVLLVGVGGSSFSLLLFLAIPFVAVVQVGRRRALWLATAVVACVVVTVVVRLPAGATAMRLTILAAVVGGTLVAARALRREALARAEAVGRARLERILVAEAEHRIKNSLQTAADLLLLGRPDGLAGRPFDMTASRIRSMAAVHSLLSESPDEHVRADLLLSRLVDDVDVPLVLDAEAVTLDAASAQRLGLVANELVTNAVQHGSPPVFVKLEGGPQTRLRVEDAGVGLAGNSSGLGLQLVRRMAEDGLGGSFELRPRSGGGTRAELVF